MYYTLPKKKMLVETITQGNTMAIFDKVAAVSDRYDLTKDEVVAKLYSDWALKLILEGKYSSALEAAKKSCRIDHADQTSMTIATSAACHLPSRSTGADLALPRVAGRQAAT